MSEKDLSQPVHNYSLRDILDSVSLGELIAIATQFNNCGVMVKKEVFNISRRILWVLVPVLLVSISGCATNSNKLSLPSSAKTISTSLIEIPFPYAESLNGEAWRLEKNGPDMALNVTNKGQIVTKIPLTDKIGTFNTEKLGKQYVGGYRYKANQTIQLGNKVYQVTEIDLNTDNESGMVVLNLSK